jgi:hypothetical protein
MQCADTVPKTLQRRPVHFRFGTLSSWLWYVFWFICQLYPLRPLTCLRALGTWPAFWYANYTSAHTFDPADWSFCFSYRTVGPNWPHGGEIDIFEGVHENTRNQATFHTADGKRVV